MLGWLRSAIIWIDSGLGSNRWCWVTAWTPMVCYLFFILPVYVKSSLFVCLFVLTDIQYLFLWRKKMTFLKAQLWKYQFCSYRIQNFNGIPIIQSGSRTVPQEKGKKCQNLLQPQFFLLCETEFPYKLSSFYGSDIYHWYALCV